MGVAKNINYFYNLLGLPTGDWKVFYDFTDISGNVVPSISGGNPKYSGVSNNLINSGHFAGQSLSVSNSSEINADSWTMFFVFEKSSKQHGVLFSNYHGELQKSGFVVGINSANKLYVESYDESGPAIYELGVRLGTKNAVAISKNLQNLHIDYFDFNSKNTLANDFKLSSRSMRKSDGWTIGNAESTPSYFNFSPFNGYIDSFVYITGVVFPKEIDTLFSGFCISDSPKYVNSVIDEKCNYSYLGLTGNISSVDLNELDYLENTISTGYLANNTGEIYSSITGSIISNSISFQGSVTGYIKVQTETGVVNSGVNFSVNSVDSTTNNDTVNFIYSSKYVGNGNNFVTTNNTIYYSNTAIQPTPFYIYKNCQQVIDLQLQDYQYNEDYIYQFGMDGLTYYTDQDITDINSFYTYPNSHNKLNVNFDGRLDRTKGAIILQPNHNLNNVNLYLNGANLFGSGFSIDDDIVTFEKDFFISGNYAYINYNIEDTDKFTFDVISGVRNGVDFLSSIYQESGRTFIGNISIDNQDVYLNGVKLHSGTDYLINSNRIEILNTGLTEASGFISIMPVDSNRNIGSGIFHSILLDRFARGTSQLWMNGIRQDLDEHYVEISQIGLLTGIKNKKIKKPYIFSELEGFWGEYEDVDFNSLFELYDENNIMPALFGMGGIFEYDEHGNIRLKDDISENNDEYFEVTESGVMPR